MEDVHQPERSGLLVFAESSDCDSLNLLRLRDDLVRAGDPLRIRFRVQREELFRAMHRLESPFVG